MIVFPNSVDCFKVIITRYGGQRHQPIQGCALAFYIVDIRKRDFYLSYIVGNE